MDNGSSITAPKWTAKWRAALLRDAHQDDLKKEVGASWIGRMATSRAGRRAAVVTGAATSLIFPPAAPAVALMQMGLDDYGRDLDAAVTVRQHRMFEAAAKEAGTDIIDFFRRLRSKDEWIMLSLEVVETARRARLQEKVTFLGQCLGRVLIDGASIDEEAVWIRLMGRLEQQHLRVLGQFVEATGTSEAGITEWRVTEARSLKDLRADAGLGEIVLPLVEDMQQVGILFNAASGGYGSNVPAGNEREVMAGALAIELLQRLEKADYKPTQMDEKPSAV